MKRRYVPLGLLLATLALGLAATLPAAASAQAKPWAGDSVLDDPEWRARFLGSYGFLSGAEPQIRSDELQMLRDVLDLMKVNPKAATQMLEAQVNADSSAALDFILGNLYFQNGNTTEAALAYTRALDKFPDFRRAHKNAGLLLVQNGDFEGGLHHLSRAIELGEKDGRTYGLLGYCHLNLENYISAEEAYRDAVLLQPETRDWQLGLARALMAMWKYEEAVAVFGGLIERSPTDETAWLGQANAFIGLERPRDAAVNLEAVRAMGKAKTSSLVLLGDIYMNEGMPDLAKSAYLDVIAEDADGTSFETAQRAASLLVRSGAYGQAREILERIEKRYGEGLSLDEELELLTLRARLARAQGRDAEAVRILESIVERDGTRGEALLELAAYHHDQGDGAKALMLVERAQNLDAYEYEALVKHAQLRAADRDYRKAAELLRKALQIRQEPRVERYLARIEQAAMM